MASNPASVISIALRVDVRGDGAACGSTSSNPPVIDLANNRLMLNFILPIRLLLYCSKFRGKTGLHLCHGYRRLAFGGFWTSNPPEALGKARENGGGYGGTAVGGDAEIGLAGAVRMGGNAGPRGDRANLHVQGFQRSLRLHGARRSGRGKERPPSGM